MYASRSYQVSEIAEHSTKLQYIQFVGKFINTNKQNEDMQYI